MYAGSTSNTIPLFPKFRTKVIVLEGDYVIITYRSTRDFFISSTVTALSWSSKNFLFTLFSLFRFPRFFFPSVPEIKSYILFIVPYFYYVLIICSCLPPLLAGFVFLNFQFSCVVFCRSLFVCMSVFVIVSFYFS
jgi:hypothetical protein